MKKNPKNLKILESLKNLNSALEQLEVGLKISKPSPIEIAGIIQHFEFSYELTWKTIQKFGDYQGKRIVSPREAFEFGFESGMITDEDLWLEMIQSRNLTTHTYQKETAKAVLDSIREDYFSAMKEMYSILQKKVDTIN